MTLNFAKIGSAKKDKTFPVYLRYQYLNDVFSSKHVYEYIPTGVYLNATDFDKLLNDGLGGKVYFQLEKFKEKTEKIVNDYHAEYKYFPDKTYLNKKVNAKELQSILPMIGDYRTSIKTEMKEASFNTISTMIQSITELITEHDAKFKTNYFYSLDQFLTEKFTKVLKQYMIDQKYENGYTILMIRLLLRIQNFGRKEAGLEKIEHSIGLKREYKHQFLKDEEVQYLIEYKTDKKNYLEAQRFLLINQKLGLRVSEILSLEKSDFKFHDDHLIIQAGEKKKNKVREVVVIEDDIIKFVKKILKEVDGDELFTINRDDINYALKRIAKYTGKFNDKVRKIKNVGKEGNEYRIERYKTISTHTIRRSAIMNRADDEGLLVAQHYSGHSDLAQLQKHYLKPLSVKDMLERKRKK